MIAKQKKGQMTIFIIIGILIVVRILLFFFLRQGIPKETSSSLEENPESFLGFCLNNKIREAITELSVRGGYIDKGISKEFRFTNEPTRNITYLCYNKNGYLPCINQKPTFMEDLKSEIKEYISKDVKDCFDGLESSLKRDGHEVELEYTDFEVDIIPGKVIVQTDSNLIFTKSGSTVDSEDFKIEVLSKLYRISLFTQEIVNQEARYCFAEINGISLIYPEFLIDKTKLDDLSNIYRIEHQESKEKFVFAVRSCAIAPGVN